VKGTVIKSTSLPSLTFSNRNYILLVKILTEGGLYKQKTWR